MKKRLLIVTLVCLGTLLVLPSAFAATAYKEAPMLADLVKAGDAV